MDTKPKLLILEPKTFSEAARRVLSTKYIVQEYRERPVPDGHTLITGLQYRINEDFLKGFHSVRTVASLTTGRNHIDVDFLSSKRIRLITLRDIRDQIASVSSTAELTLALVLSLGRRVSQSGASIAEHGRWRRADFFTRELKGQTLGIIGFGRIGKMVSTMAQAIGLRVIAVDTDAFVPGAFRRDRLYDLLKESDIVSLHADDRGTVLLGETEISRCRKGAMIVNTARGELVDEMAISKGIKSGRLSGYAADVLSGENRERWNVRDDVLVRLAKEGHNVVLTPHLGGYTQQAFRATQMAMVNLLVQTQSD